VKELAELSLKAREEKA
jgi:hypothetical protein